jgi:hypothetical protein
MRLNDAIGSVGAQSVESDAQTYPVVWVPIAPAEGRWFLAKAGSRRTVVRPPSCVGPYMSRQALFALIPVCAAAMARGYGM